MSAWMANIQVALLAAVVVASLGSEGQIEPENDTVSFLQAQVQVGVELHEQQKQSKQLVDEADSTGGYNLADDLACASNKAQPQAVLPKSPIAFVEPATPVASLKERFGPVRLTPEAESGDPPGASELRAILELMIIVIIFDGMRRWRLRKKEEASKQKTASPTEEAEQAAEAAWIDMVNAASAGNAVSFEKALGSNPSPSVTRTDTWGCTPLHFAAAGGSTAITAELLRKRVQVDPLDASDETPLHLAARAGHSPICELLLDAGAAINAVNVQDMTPLVVAGHSNQEAACRLIFDRGGGAGGLTDEQLPPLVVSQLIRKVFEA